MMPRNAQLLALFVLASLVLGCSIDLQFQNVTSLHDHNMINPDIVVIQQGTATASKLVDGDEFLDEDSAIEVWSESEFILAVEPTLDYDVFAFYGINPGESEVTVMIDDEVIAIIPAIVIEQE